MIDRTEFKKVVEEINLSRSDYAEEANAIEVGKVLAADYILTGTIFKSFGNYSIVAKLINPAKANKIERITVINESTVKTSKKSLRIDNIKNTIKKPKSIRFPIR